MLTRNQMCYLHTKIKLEGSLHWCVKYVFTADCKVRFLFRVKLKNLKNDNFIYAYILERLL